MLLIGQTQDLSSFSRGVRRETTARLRTDTPRLAIRAAGRCQWRLQLRTMRLPAPLPPGCHTGQLRRLLSLRHGEMTVTATGEVPRRAAPMTSLRNPATDTSTRRPGARARQVAPSARRRTSSLRPAGRRRRADRRREGAGRRAGPPHPPPTTRGGPKVRLNAGTAATGSRAKRGLA
jgi:hypothetical protein